eukprot:12824352-Prorocentrum_lima.AAC.1
MTRALKAKGFVVSTQGDQVPGPVEVYQGMSVADDDSEGDQGAEPRRSTGRTCKSVLKRVKEDAIVLPEVLQGSPFHLEVVQVWDAYDG